MFSAPSPHRRVALSLLLCGWIGLGRAQTPKKKVAFIPKGNSHVFWREMARGATDAARELGVHMEWRGPSNEDGIDAQSSIMGIYIRSRFDGLLLAPNSTDALQASIGKASAAGMKVMIVDSPLAEGAGLPYVGTNNRQAGALAARQAAKDNPQARRVLVLRYAPKQGSTTAREEGFIQTLRTLLPKATIDDGHYSGITVHEAELALGDILKNAEPFDILFTPNESGTVGAVNVLQARGRASRIKAYGFDYTARIHEALRNGTLQAVIIQDPYLMGHKAMALMHDALAGRAVPPVFETPAVVVTRSNLDAPGIRAKTDPFLALTAR